MLPFFSNTESLTEDLPIKRVIAILDIHAKRFPSNTTLMNLLKVLRSKELKILLLFTSKMHTHHTICPCPDAEGMAYNTQHTGGIILLGDLEKLKNTQQSTQEEKKRN